jgi:hypothetical protein
VKGREHVEDLGVDENMILKLILKKQKIATYNPERK